MRIEHGTSLRWYQGVAWKDWQTLTWVVYPIPFNLFARWARDLWFVLAAPGPQPMEHDWYMKGYADALAEVSRKNRYG